MKYKELKENLNELNEGQLDAEVLIWSTEDSALYDNVEYNYKGNIEIAKASDILNDENATYFVI
tara:strand:- start:89 stop:280 length:192 start_codon:yes stop_codon:yes gene_type:complete